MNLTTSLSIASSGLSAVQHELAVASQNVANASTPGYVAEVSNVASRDAGGQGSGVVVQLTSRAVNATLQNALYKQNANVAALNVTTNALGAISSVQGSTNADPGASGTLSDNLGNLQNTFTTLESDPSNPTRQQAVVSAAASLANTIHTLSNTYQAERQGAQAAIVSDVASVNNNLATIGSLSKNIVRLQASGQDTADLQNQRSAALASLSSLLQVNFNETASGNLVVTTANGLVLPTDAASGPLSTQQATIGAADAYPGTIQGIKLDGQDVTASLSGGSLGANIALRDATLPTMQGELDSFSSTLATRFSSQGLTLFTDGSGNSPGADPTQPSPLGQLGLSGGLQVNPAVTANPARVRDGTQAIQDPTPGAASAPGAILTGATAFTPNPAGGPVGFTTLISRILGNTLGTTIAPGTAQPTAIQAGLGANGTLSASYSGAGSLATLATTLTSSQAQTIADATAQQTSQSDIQATLQGQLTASSGVSIDDQMANVVTLQNAYEANAKVLAAVQTMFTNLLAAIN